ncbi:MAG TPA: hypothetical protein VFM46_12450 [Pseudomonadales bacterium]|nr:hypothetical protein [Pseudomonadales bacterium]
MDFINVAILKNPLNWVTVLMMLVLFGLFADVILGHYQELQNDLNPHPASKQ